MTGEDTPIKATITEAVQAAQRKFAEKPQDYLSSERAAQALLFCELKQRVDGSVVIRRDAVPPLHGLPETRVKLEWPVYGKGYPKHDIAVLAKTEETEKSKHYKCHSWGYEDLEAFIEVKSGWKNTITILTEARGDFEKLSACQHKGYVVIFVGNEFNAMTKHLRNSYCTRLQEYKEKYGFCDGHVFVVFRDGILPGEGDFEPSER